MRRGALLGARSVLLAGPVALAFFSGGYFDGPRVWAGLVTWALVAVAALASGSPLPRGRAGRVAIAGLFLLAGWTLASLTWAPIEGTAYHAGQIAFLYTGALIAAGALLRERAAVRAVEPAVAAGTLIVIGYGISERLVPGVLSFHHSASATGRLEQPLTYWNAMGAIGALGVVLCARLAGDATRGALLRIAAAAAAAPLGLGLYLSFSRGALFACAAGLVALIVLAPARDQLWGIAVALAAGVLAALAAAPSHSVTTLAGSLGGRQREGAITFVLLVVVAVGAALAQAAIARRGPRGGLALPRRAPLIALALICGAFALSLAVGAKERSTAPLSSGATRYTTLESNRYTYWRVAVRAWRDEPLRGVGAGGWAVYWLRLRPFAEGAQDAHSLYIQTLAELGVVGLALLAVFLAGIGFAARSAHRAAPAAAAGPAAGFIVWVAHVALDWDWQMPAVTLLALILAGALLAIADLGPEREASAAGAAAEPRTAPALP